MANEDHRVGFDRLFESAGVGFALNSARAALGATAYAGAVSRASNALAAAMRRKAGCAGPHWIVSWHTPYPPQAFKDSPS